MRRAVVVAAPLLAACSLIVSTSGYSGGDAKTAIAEAGTDGATAPSDAASDAASDTKPSGPFCATSPGHVVCDDFDEGTAATNSGWTTAGGIEVSSEQASSAPASLKATRARAGSAAAEGDASLYRKFDGDLRHVLLEFDAYLVAPAWLAGDSTFGLACIAYHSNGTQIDGSCLSTDATNTAASVASGYTNQGPTFPTNRWVHVRYDLDPAGRLEVRIGQDVTLTRTFAALVGPATQTGIEVGVLQYNAPAPAVTAYFDNITVDFL